MATALETVPLVRFLRDRRSDAPEGSVGSEHDLEATGDGGGIRCPHCRYRPARDERWACTCGHSWNTFETRGICPACGHVWTETQCPRCAAWSPHAAWYEGGATPLG